MNSSTQSYLYRTVKHANTHTHTHFRGPIAHLCRKCKRKGIKDYRKDIFRSLAMQPLHGDSGLSWRGCNLCQREFLALSFSALSLQLLSFARASNSLFTCMDVSKKRPHNPHLAVGRTQYEPPFPHVNSSIRTLS